MTQMGKPDPVGIIRIVYLSSNVKEYSAKYFEFSPVDTVPAVNI